MDTSFTNQYLLYLYHPSLLLEGSSSLLPSLLSDLLVTGWLEGLSLPKGSGQPVPGGCLAAAAPRRAAGFFTL